MTDRLTELAREFFETEDSAHLSMQGSYGYVAERNARLAALLRRVELEGATRGAIEVLMRLSDEECCCCIFGIQEPELRGDFWVHDPDADAVDCECQGAWDMIAKLRAQLAALDNGASWTETSKCPCDTTGAGE